MSNFVGKKFPNIEVDAMNEMGDAFKVNVLEEARTQFVFWSEVHF